MLNIERRIAALEAATIPVDDMTIIRRFVRPGHLDAEMFCLRDDDGNLWTRQSNETEQDLIDRASSEVKRSAWGIASLSMVDVEASNASH